jgi:quercetin dioxygenase-like cupin family protein
MNPTRALVVLGLAAQCASAMAQSPPVSAAPARPAATRTVIAATKLPTVTDKPLLFRAVGITIAPGERQTISAPGGVLYQVSGSAEVTIGADVKTLNPGEGIYIAGGTSASVRARSGEPSTAIDFLLSPVAEANRPVTTAPAVEKELYRTPAAIPNLKPGSYDLNLTRITFPPGMPSNAPHHRSGAALYYIVSGTGANTVGGRTEAKGPGSWIYEPSTLVHQWGNPGDVPMTFLTININQEGVPAVVPDPPARSQ